MAGSGRHQIDSCPSLDHETASGVEDQPKADQSDDQSTELGNSQLPRLSPALGTESGPPPLLSTHGEEAGSDQADRHPQAEPRHQEQSPPGFSLGDRSQQQHYRRSRGHQPSRQPQGSE